jgi:hypothetical protein
METEECSAMKKKQKRLSTSGDSEAGRPAWLWTAVTFMGSGNVCNSCFIGKNGSSRVNLGWQ